MKIWLCYLNEKLVKGVATYDQAFAWAQAHEKLSLETNIKHTIELNELIIEKPQEKSR